VAVGWKEAHYSGVSTAVVLDLQRNDGTGPMAGSRCLGNWSTSSGVRGRSVRVVDRRRLVARE
jgi:hypothetical protein